MNQFFLVEAALESPVVLGDGYLTLDGLLAAVLFSRSNALNIDDIPLKKTEGVYHGSQAFFDIKSNFSQRVLIRGMRCNDLETGEWIADDPKKPNSATVGYKFNSARHEVVKNVMNERNLVCSDYVLWFGCGDIIKVRDLLRDVTSIGAKRGQGYGQIAVDAQTGIPCITVTECKSDLSLFIDGRPSRPLPIELWNEQHNGVEVSVIQTPIDLPVWHSKPVVCAIPDSQLYNLSRIRKSAIN